MVLHQGIPSPTTAMLMSKILLSPWISKCIKWLTSPRKTHNWSNYSRASWLILVNHHRSGFTSIQLEKSSRSRGFMEGRKQQNNKSLGNYLDQHVSHLYGFWIKWFMYHKCQLCEYWFVAVSTIWRNYLNRVNLRRN